MAFIADNQTLDDLNIRGRYKSNSLYSIFNQTRTHGGALLMDRMFNHPLTDEKEINRRSSIFQYFQQQAWEFPVDTDEFSMMETYLLSGGSQGWVSNALQVTRRRSLKAMGLLQEYQLFNKGFYTTLRLMRQWHSFFQQMDQPDSPIREELAAFHQLYSHEKLSWLLKPVAEASLNGMQVANYDHQLRNALHEEMKAFLQLIYFVDVCMAVADIAREKGFVYATALPRDRRIITVKDCRHPGLEKAIGNDLTLDQHNNMLFLTGANMAGKSTFMKSFGVAVYMAHMGFPVAAASMQFSVRDGIYSSINVPDNLDMGLSHFYAEVLRVKTVAEEVASKKDLLVIFDELFKGTNVKDAYDATLAVADAFSAYRNCAFIISTHIIEVGSVLMEKCNNLQFAYLPTVMDGAIPRYTYQMREGITSDRHGMMIIENEKILDIIG
jgi:DNA mismatch repair ATPase MutS